MQESVYASYVFLKVAVIFTIKLHFASTLYSLLSILYFLFSTLCFLLPNHLIPNYLIPN